MTVFFKYITSLIYRRHKIDVVKSKKKLLGPCWLSPINIFHSNEKVQIRAESTTLTCCLSSSLISAKARFVILIWLIISPSGCKQIHQFMHFEKLFLISFKKVKENIKTRICLFILRVSLILSNCAAPECYNFIRPGLKPHLGNI